MNTATITKKVKALAAAVSIVALTSLAMPAQAEQDRGLGGLGVVAGGVVGGLGNSIGGLALFSTTGNTGGGPINDNDGGSDGISAGLDVDAKKDVKPKLTVGGTKGLKAKVGVAKVGTGGADAKVSSLDENNGGGGGGSGDNDGISHEIAGLSAYERQQLRRKCIYVLSSPASFNRDAVQVCRVLAGL